MSNKPVWAVCSALQTAGVPCALEIAMMLGRRKTPAPDVPVAPEIPEEPYAQGTLQAVGGSYVSLVEFSTTDSSRMETVTPFLVGAFPLEQAFRWEHDSNDDGYGTADAYIDLQITDMGWTPKVGDFIKLRYMLPEVQLCRFRNIYQTVQAGQKPNYYTFEMGFHGLGGGKSALCTVTHSTEDGVVACYDKAQDSPQSYTEVFANRTFTPIVDGNNLLGFELTGWLMCPITSIRIKINGHNNDGDRAPWRYAWLNVKYAAHDNLTIEAYEIPMPEQLATGDSLWTN